MGVAHFFDIRDQPIRKFDVTQISVVLFGNSRPRRKVNLVYTDGLLRPVPGLAFRYPGVVTPFEAIEIENQGGRLHSMLAEKRERIAFQHNIAEAVADLVLIMIVFPNPWDEYFPDPCFDALSHLVGAAIPAVKIAHYADPLSIGSPNRKTHTRMSLDFRKVRSELFVDLIMVADFVQVHVQFT